MIQRHLSEIHLVTSLVRRKINAQGYRCRKNEKDGVKSEIMTNRVNFLLLVFLQVWPSFALADSDFEQAAEAYSNNNYAVAFPAFTRLAEQGDARAQTVLALMYKYGEGTTEDPSQAFKWYQRAAKLNYPPAQFNLGLMHQEGRGTAINHELAIHWYIKAASGGFKRANEKLEELNTTSLSNTDIAEPLIQAPEKWNFRLPNSQRRLTQAETEHRSTAMQNRISSRAATYHVQLGAMSSIKAAETLWDQIVFLSPRLFTQQKMLIKASDNTPNSIYLLQTGPFASLSEATSFCRNISQHGVRTGCLPLSSINE